jgi:hypothetical protein
MMSLYDLVMKASADEPFEIISTDANGYNLYKQKNKAGGFSYYNETNGDIFLIWDSCIGSKHELEAILKDLT